MPSLRDRIWASTPAPGIRGAPVRLVRLTVLVLEGVARNALVSTAAALAFLSLLAWPIVTALLFALDPGLGWGAHHSKTLGKIDRNVVLSASLALTLVMLGWILTLLERAFNAMWAARRPRTLVRRLAVYWLILTLGAAGTAMSVVFIPRWVEGLVPQMALSFALGTLVLTVLYIFLPNTRIPAVSAFAGAIVGAAALVALQSTANLIGDGSIPLYLLWTLLAWLAVLFGAQIVFASQHVGVVRRELELPTASYAARQRLALRITLSVCRDFLAGRPAPTAETLAQQLGVPLRLVSQIVYQLTASGMLKELARGGGHRTGGLVPSRDPGEITPQQVLEALRNYGSDIGTLPEDPQAAALDEAVAKIFDRADSNLSRINFRRLSQNESGTPGPAGSA